MTKTIHLIGQIKSLFSSYLQHHNDHQWPWGHSQNSHYKSTRTSCEEPKQDILSEVWKCYGLFRLRLQQFPDAWSAEATLWERKVIKVDGSLTGFNLWLSWGSSREAFGALKCWRTLEAAGYLPTTDVLFLGGTTLKENISQKAWATHLHFSKPQTCCSGVWLCGALAGICAHSKWVKSWCLGKDGGLGWNQKDSWTSKGFADTHTELQVKLKSNLWSGHTGAWKATKCRGQTDH